MAADSRRAVSHPVRDWCLRNLARPQGVQAFSAPIDGLRFVAISAVLLYHLEGYYSAQYPAAHQSPVNQFWALGYFGVPLFFAISGYIIAKPFTNGSNPVFSAYMLRRLSRLEPPYLINLLAIFALKVAVLGVAASDLLPNLLASATYSHNLVYGAHSLVNGVAWSLEIEWQFYLIAPLLFLLILTPKGPRHLSWMLVLLGGGCYALMAAMPSRVALSLVAYFGFFVAGVVVAAWDSHAPVGRLSGRYDALAALAALAVVVILLADQRAVFAALPALTGLLLYASLRGRKTSAFLGWWPVYIVGGMCYSIYLYHFFVISLLGRWLMPHLPLTPGSVSNMLLLAAWLLPMVIGACVLPYLLIERPFMLWRPGKTRLRDSFRWPR
jgi:peptidoglycan/LPS O-acetylase OafA/YrhL